MTEEQRERKRARDRERRRRELGWYEPGGMATDEEMAAFADSYRAVMAG